MIYIITLTLLFILMVLRIIWKKSKNNNSVTQNLPPGPYQLPLIGNIHLLVGHVPHLRVTELAKKYGPVMRLQLGELTTVVLSSPETARQVFKTHDLNFSQRPILMGNDIVTYQKKGIGSCPEGPYWRMLRKVSMQWMLNAKRVESFRSIREEEVSKLISSISSKAGSPIYTSKYINALAFRLVSRATTGKIREKEDEFITSMGNLLIELAKSVTLGDVFPSIKLFKVISRGMIKFKLEKYFKQVDNIIQDILNQHRDTISTAAQKEDHLLHALLDLQNKDQLQFPLFDDNFKAVIMDVFIGGTSTIGEVIEWTMSELMKNPRVMEKAQAEVREIFGAEGNVNEVGIHNLNYLKLVVNETLRLHPPAPLIPPRECKDNCVIDGYDIPAKSNVIINLWALGRDPKYWNDPEKFHPERFLDDSIDNKNNNFEYLPFGGGRRICPGNLFAMAIIELSLAQMLFHFNWTLPPGQTPEDIDMSAQISLGGFRPSSLCLVPFPYVP